jgi:hypothetical protein
MKTVEELYKVKNSIKNKSKPIIVGLEKEDDVDDDADESISQAIQEDLIDKDTAFMDDMLYTPLTKQEIKKDMKENKIIESSLKKIVIDIKSNITQNIKENIKENKENINTNRKSKKSLKSRKSSKSKSKSKSKKLKVVRPIKFGGAKDPMADITEEDLKQYSEFLDQISLKTESGVLPLFRKFEDNEENILACIFYGFYMRLGFNLAKNNYLVKLSKIIAKNKKNYYAFAKEAPELVIYQNLSIDEAKNMVTIGIVSKLTPRIINSFI